MSELDRKMLIIGNVLVSILILAIVALLIYGAMCAHEREKRGPQPAEAREVRMEVGHDQ